MDTIDCPRCEHSHEPVGSHEDDSGEMLCEKCGFKFKVEIDYEPCYSTLCAVHDFSQTLRYGDKIYDKCSICGTIREINCESKD